MPKKLLKIPLKTLMNVGYAVMKGLFARNIMTAGTLVNAKTVRIEPPAVLSYEKIDIVIAKLDEAIADAKKVFKL